MSAETRVGVGALKNAAESASPAAQEPPSSLTQSHDQRAGPEPPGRP